MTMTETNTYKKTKKKTKTHTHTKCFQGPMYAIFLKSRGFKDLKYYVDSSFDGGGHGNGVPFHF